MKMVKEVWNSPQGRLWRLRVNLFYALCILGFPFSLVYTIIKAALVR